MDALRALFSGEITPAQAAGELREANRLRTGIEQIIGGILFDPTIFISPIAIIKTGVGQSVLRLARIPTKAVRLNLVERSTVVTSRGKGLNPSQPDGGGLSRPAGKPTMGMRGPLLTQNSFQNTLLVASVWMPTPVRGSGCGRG